MHDDHGTTRSRHKMTPFRSPHRLWSRAPEPAGSDRCDSTTGQLLQQASGGKIRNRERSQRLSYPEIECPPEAGNQSRGSINRLPGGGVVLLRPAAR